MGLEQFDTILAFSAVMLTLSLLITILVQMVLTAMNMRGRALGWGVERLLQQVDPKLNLGDMAGKLSQAILKHPSLTHRGSTMAIAIRKDELLKVIEDLAERGNTAPQKSEAMGLVKAAPDLSDDERQRLKDAILRVAPGATPEQAQSAAALTSELLKVFPGADAAVGRAVASALKAKRQIEVEVEKWFDTVMDRSTEYFVKQTRWVTAIVAFAVAIALHVDALGIFAQLTSSKDLRNQWSEAVPGLLKQAGDLSLDSGKPYPLGTKAVLLLKDEKVLTDDDRKTVDGVKEDLLTRAAGQDWVDKANLSKAAKELYPRKADEAAKKRMDELSTAFTNVRAVAAGTSLQIVRYPWPAFPDKSYLGVLMSALLLGLGAPFWFNLLKQLTNLRPLIAGKVEKEEKG